MRTCRPSGRAQRDGSLIPRPPATPLLPKGRVELGRRPSDRGHVTSSKVLPLAFALAFAPAAAAAGAPLSVTPATFDAVASVAQAGDAVELASGAYGRRTITQDKLGFVTFQPAPGATVSISPTLTGASYLRFSGFSGASSIVELNINGSNPNHLEVTASRFTGQAVIDVNGDANTAIVLDGNSHRGISAPSDMPEGRIQVSGSMSGPPSGVTIRNSYIGEGGCSDGLQIGA